MYTVTLLAAAWESLALVQERDPVLILAMFGLVMIQIWTVRVASTVLAELLRDGASTTDWFAAVRAAVAATAAALAVTAIPAVVLALLFLSVV